MCSKKMLLQSTPTAGYAVPKAELFSAASAVKESPAVLKAAVG
jgi:hypothetical protein